MPNEKVIDYYLLCSLSMGKSAHILSEVSELRKILTEKEEAEYLRRLNGKLVANELVIGGENDNDLSQFVIWKHKSHKDMDPFDSRFRFYDGAACLIFH